MATWADIVAGRTGGATSSSNQCVQCRQNPCECSFWKIWRNPYLLMYIFSLNRNTENLRWLIYPVKLQYFEFFKYTTDISEYKYRKVGDLVLDMATRSGNFELMKIVINLGANIVSNTLFNNYIRMDKLNFLKFLHENNVIILHQSGVLNFTCSFGTGLREAALRERYEIMEWLLDIEEPTIFTLKIALDYLNHHLRTKNNCPPIAQKLFDRIIEKVCCVECHRFGGCVWVDEGLNFYCKACAIKYINASLKDLNNDLYNDYVAIAHRSRMEHLTAELERITKI